MVNIHKVSICENIKLCESVLSAVIALKKIDVNASNLPQVTLLGHISYFLEAGSR